MRILYRQRLWVIAITIWVVASVIVLGQAVPIRKIDQTQMCRACTLRIDKVVRLSDPGSINGSAGNISVIDRDSRGRLWVVDFGSQHNVLVFNPDGKLLKKIGRNGRGPGEFEDVRHLFVGPGDTVHVFSSGRRSVISPATLDVVASSNWTGNTYGVKRLSNGNYIMASPRGDFAGRLYDEMSPAGKLVRSFGGPGKKEPSYTRRWYGRWIAPDPAGGFFAVPRKNYVIEHWGTNATLVGILDRAAPWFPFSAPSPKWTGPEEGLGSEVFGVWRGSGDLLFVGSHVLQAGWKRALELVSSEGGAKVWDVTDYDKYFDSIIEVIDLKTGALLAATRHDLHFWNAGNGEVYAKGDDPDDFIDIYRVTFVRR